MSLMHLEFGLAVMLAGVIGIVVKVFSKKKKRGSSKGEDQLEIK